MFICNIEYFCLSSGSLATKNILYPSSTQSLSTFTSYGGETLDIQPSVSNTLSLAGVWVATHALTSLTTHLHIPMQLSPSSTQLTPRNTPTDGSDRESTSRSFGAIVGAVVGLLLAVGLVLALVLVLLCVLHRRNMYRVKEKDNPVHAGQLLWHNYLKAILV